MSDKKNEKVEAEKHRNEKIEESGQVTLDRNDRNRTIHLISIIGEVEGHDNLGSNSKTTKYEHILPQLAAIEDSSETGAVKYHGRRCGSGTCHCRDDRFFK